MKNFTPQTLRKAALILAIVVSAPFIHPVVAQSASPEVLSTCGSEFSGAGYTHTFTMGQAFYLTRTNEEGNITEGFIQPWSIISCLGDFTGDNTINTGDLLILMAGYGCTMSCPADLTGDGVVNVGDILLFMGLFGTTC